MIYKLTAGQEVFQTDDYAEAIAWFDARADRMEIVIESNGFRRRHHPLCRPIDLRKKKFPRSFRR